MSTEHQDQHLSDAVDGQLSAERLGELRRDEELATRLRELRRDSANLKQLGQRTRQELIAQRLGADGQPRSMAAAVLAESIRRADQQQLDAAHPLMLASDSIGVQPVRLRDRRMSTARWSAVAMLAASVALWFTLAPPSAPELALDIELEGDNVTVAGGVSNDAPAGGSSAVASSTVDSTSVDEQIEREVDADPAGNPPSEPSAPNEMMLAADPPEQKSFAERSDIREQPDAPATTAAETDSPLRNQFLMVYDVQLTAMGRALRPVRTAMLAAGLDSSDQYRVDQSVVDVAQSITKPDEAFRVMVLRAPLTTLDGLFVALASDKQSVASIGLTLADNAAVAKMVRSVSQQAATKESVGIELTDDRGQPPVQLAGWIGNQSFLPVSGRNALGSSGGITGKSAADGTVLVLIR